MCFISLKGDEIEILDVYDFCLDRVRLKIEKEGNPLIAQSPVPKLITREKKMIAEIFVPNAYFQRDMKEMRLLCIKMMDTFS